MTASPPRYVGVARPSDLEHALLLGPDDLSFAWCRADQRVFAAAVGAIAEDVGEVQWLGAPPPRALPGPWFGGWSFDETRAWDGFDLERWVLPEVVAFGPPGEVWIAAFAREGTPPEALHARLDRVCDCVPASFVNGAVREPSDRGAWERLVDEALTSIASGRLDKLVLAREVVVHGRRGFDVRTVLLHLLAMHGSAWVFLVRGRHGDAFVGASPETLCVVTEGRLETEALAGTSRDDAVASLTSTKERHEHALVVDGIRASLRPYVRNFEAAALPALKSQGRLRHLHTPVSADLLARVEPTLAARALHPTPAVAGSPARTAVDWLAEREDFVRGWYAGAVGVRGAASLHLAVAIRSALVHGRTARVFVGAGVVPGSLAEREWEETELKASVMLRALGVAEGD